MNEIIERYQQLLMEEMHNSGFYAVLEIKPLEGDESNDIHLLWMLSELNLNPLKTLEQKAYSLGFIQGVMVAKGYITISEERELI